MGLAGLRSILRKVIAGLGVLALAGGALAVSGAAASAAAAAAAVDSITLTNGSPGEGVEGNTITNQVVAHFADSGNSDVLAAGFCSDLNTRYSTTIDWGDGNTSSGSVFCDLVGGEVPSGTFSVKGSHMYVDSGTYTIAVSVTDTTDDPHVTASGTTDSAQISDAAIEADFDNMPDGGFKAVEGKSVDIGVAFFDNNRAFQNTEGPAFDSGIKATVDWGDQTPVESVTPVAAPAECDCAGDFLVVASHLYDATKSASDHYTITVTATDDGGQTATDTLTAAVSDAVLTAGTKKSLAATAGKAFSGAVASFTDAAGAQAAASDYSATIKWGDNTTSTATITKTGTGAFSVSGSHTWASKGNKTLTVTVTDEEGQTVTITATATVGAAPIVLPQTGEPGQPAPASSLGFLALAWLGLSSLAIGLTRLRANRP